MFGTVSGETYDAITGASGTWTGTTNVLGVMVLPLIPQILKRLKMIHGITLYSHIIVVQVNTVVLVLVVLQD